MVGGEEKGGVISAPQPFSTAMIAGLLALPQLLAFQTCAQTALLPPIERSYLFGTWLIKYDLRGNVYRVSGLVSGSEEYCPSASVQNTARRRTRPSCRENPT